MHLSLDANQHSAARSTRRDTLWQAHAKLLASVLNYIADNTPHTRRDQLRRVHVRASNTQHTRRRRRRRRTQTVTTTADARQRHRTTKTRGMRSYPRSGANMYGGGRTNAGATPPKKCNFNIVACDTSQCVKCSSAASPVAAAAAASRAECGRRMFNMCSFHANTPSNRRQKGPLQYINETTWAARDMHAIRLCNLVCRARHY